METIHSSAAQILNFKSLDSTNTKAKERIPQYSQIEWIVAEEQTAGRGRRGKDWKSELGNLFTSYLQDWKYPYDQLPLYSYVAAIALHKSICSFLEPHQNLQLKWPNDVILDHHKIAGILLESVNYKGIRFLVTGFGVNLKQKPQLHQYNIKPGSIEELTGIKIGCQEFLKVLINETKEWEHVFSEKGFENIRKKWLSNAYRLGEKITCEISGKKNHGFFETINSNGQAVIRTNKGLKNISAGDIFFE